MTRSARILVVDDDPWIQKMVSTILAKRGHVVDVASDGEEALLRATSAHPDLIIADVMMPRMDGWSFVRAVRSRPEFDRTPVIFMTAFGGSLDRLRGSRLGADDFVPKPFRFEDLESRVAAALAKRRGEEPEVDATPTPPPQSLPEAIQQELSGRRVAALPEEPERRRTVLQGTLDHVGLSSLLVLLEMERKTGELVLQRRSDLGRVIFRRGQVVRASVSRTDSRSTFPQSGPHAVYELLNWSEGRFEFNPMDAVPGEDEMSCSTTYLLMEGARLADETARSRN